MDTCNLDGESNLKQRQAIRAMGKYHSSPGQMDFFPEEFKYRVWIFPSSMTIHFSF